MKHRLTYLTTLAAALLLASCTNDNDGTPAPDPQTGSATFRISTRAGQQGPPAGQHAALYVAERRPESGKDEPICITPVQDLGSGAFLLENMTAQWYKLAFVCAPQNVILEDVVEDSIFNNIKLDYSPVLERGTSDDPDNFQPPDEELGIFREVIDRWLLPDKQLQEDVTLHRITGQLILNMDVLKEQFAGQVTNISVTLADLHTKVYLHDNSNGEIIYPTDADSTYTYNFPVSTEEWESNEDYEMCFNLLPDTLSGNYVEETTNDEVEGSYITITRCPEGKTPAEVDADETLEFDTEKYPLVSTKGSGIVIKANTRTHVYFNGVESGEFVVRYFDLGNPGGGGIGVADDEWNGWE